MHCWSAYFFTNHQECIFSFRICHRCSQICQQHSVKICKAAQKIPVLNQRTCLNYSITVDRFKNLIDWMVICLRRYSAILQLLKWNLWLPVKASKKSIYTLYKSHIYILQSPYIHFTLYIYNYMCIYNVKFLVAVIVNCI